MDVDGLLVVLNHLLFSVVRSNATLMFLHTVVVPLWKYEGEECVANAFPRLTAGGAVVQIWGGRAILENRRQKRDFDPTKGFPGQDIDK